LVLRKLVETTAKKSGLLTVGGILAIAGAGLSVFRGAFGLLSLIGAIKAIQGGVGFIRRPYEDALLVAGLFGLIGFVFGLAGGIKALRRKQFAFSMVGISLLLLAGYLNFLAIIIPYRGMFWILMFGLPIVHLALPSLVFIALNRAEFT
jgi:hypothetical protein